MTIWPVFTCLFWFFRTLRLWKSFRQPVPASEAARSGLCRDPFRAPAPSEKRLHPGGDHRGRNPRNCPERIFCRADPLLYAWKRQRSRKSGNIRDSLPPPGQGCGSRRPGRCRGSLSHQGFFRSVCQSCGSGVFLLPPCRRGRRPGQRRLRRQLWRGTDRAWSSQRGRSAGNEPACPNSRSAWSCAPPAISRQAPALPWPNTRSGTFWNWAFPAPSTRIT